MTRAAFYPPADRAAQAFSKAYKGSPIHPNVLVLHTTEGMTWPSYSGGAVAPHITAKPNMKTKRLDFRQHFPLNMSARALQNDIGGVETNTLNAAQIELVGTCAPANKGKKGWFCWPEAPDWALEGVAEFVAFLNKEWSLQIKGAPLWLPYPESYGKTRARFSFTQWRNFYGVCGHQHVPENDHGDPGNIDIKTILTKARALTKPAPKTPAADKVVEIAQSALDGKGSKTRKEQWQVICKAARSLQK